MLDTVISLRFPQDQQAEDGARFEVHFEKNRPFYGHDAKPFEASLGSNGWEIRDLVDVTMDRIISLSEEGYAIRDIALEMNITPSRAGRIQKKAREMGKLNSPIPKAGRKPFSQQIKDDAGENK